MHLFDWLARRNARKNNPFSLSDLLCLEVKIEEFRFDLIVFRTKLDLNDMRDPVSRIGLHIELQFFRLLGLEIEVIIKAHLLRHYSHLFPLRIDEDRHKLKFNDFFVWACIEEAINDEGLVNADDAVVERGPFDAFMLGKRFLKGLTDPLILQIHWELL